MKITGALVAPVFVIYFCPLISAFMDRRKAILFLTIFIDLLGFGIIIPILPNYAEELGASEFMIGVIAAVFSLMQFVFTPIWGTLSDQKGRRPMMLISIAITCIAYLLFSQATTLWLLIISRCLAGLGSGNISVAQAYIADITPPEQRAKSMGMIGAAFGLGFIFGPPAGGLIMEYWGIMYVGLICGALCLINLVLAFFVLPESLGEKIQARKINILPVKDFVKVLSSGGPRELFLINFIYITAFFTFQITATLLWDDKYGFGDKEIGYLFAFIGICTAVMQGGLVGFFTRVFGEFRLLTIGTYMLMFCLLVISFIPEAYFIPFELIILLFLAIANGMVGPSSLSLLSAMTDKHEQGRRLGLFQSFGSMARVIGPLMAGMLYGINMHLPYLVGAALLLVNVFLCYNIKKFRPGIEKDTSAEEIITPAPVADIIPENTDLEK